MTVLRMQSVGTPRAASSVSVEKASREMAEHAEVCALASLSLSM